MSWKRVVVPDRQTTQAGGFDFLESIQLIVGFLKVYQFVLWRSGTANSFVLRARQATYRLAELTPWIRFLGSLKVYKIELSSCSFLPSAL
jgi:hypothetical protein